MKKLLLSLLFVSLFAGTGFAQHQSATKVKTTTKVNADAGIFKFKDGSNPTHDFGKLAKGKKVKYDFVYKNVGTNAIVIKDVKSNCGCTVPKWPIEPIAKGKTGTINVVLDTKDLLEGSFAKDITIISDAQESPKLLHIKGTVVKK